jgi:hypothetical protein
MVRVRGSKRRHAGSGAGGGVKVAAAVAARARTASRGNATPAVVSSHDRRWIRRPPAPRPVSSPATCAALFASRYKTERTRLPSTTVGMVASWKGVACLTLLQIASQDCCRRDAKGADMTIVLLGKALVPASLRELAQS